jgi:hypothetical protein
LTHTSTRILRALLATLAAGIASIAAHDASAHDLSQSLIKPGEQTFTLNLSRILNQFETRLKMSGETLTGSDIAAASRSAASTAGSCGG